MPEYYRTKIMDVPIWFELSSALIRVDVDVSLIDVLGVPTIYFLEYDRGKVTNIQPQREFDKIQPQKAKFLLHLTDIHLGEDHGFRPPGPPPGRIDVSARPTLVEVLCRDLERIDAFGKIAGVIVSGDIVTRGGWDRTYRSGNSYITGLQVAQSFLQDLSEKLAVSPEWFFMVPGNHDIVRPPGSDPTKVPAILLDYKHENGFRALRERFCGIYKLSPLNYVVKIEIGGRKLIIGLLNSAYLNDHVTFSEYGFVGDDAEHVFQIMQKASDFTKLLVLHHHLLPIYEREIVSDGSQISLTLDAAKIVRRAQEVGVCSVLHGHQHFAKRINCASFSPEMEKQFRNLRHGISVLAGGSAGVKDERLPKGESNTYGLVDISKSKPSLRIRRIYPTNRLGEEW